MPKSTDIKHTSVQEVKWNGAGSGTSKGATVKRGNDLRVKGSSK